MTIKPLRILALVVVASWCGGSSRGQQFQPTPYPMPGQAVGMPAQGQTLPGMMADGVTPVGYYQGGFPQSGYVNSGMYDAGPLQGMPYGQNMSYASQPMMSSGYGSQVVDGGSYGASYGGGSYDGGSYTGSPGGSYDNDPVGGFLESAVGDSENFSTPCYSAGHCYGYTRIEAFYLDRDVKTDLAFTSQRVGGPIVLGARNVDFEYEPGIRGVAGVPLSDCMALEASYFGLHEWDDTAAVTDPQGNLFSVFSNFGTGAGFVINGRQVFDFTEGSTMQSIAYRSEIHNADLNLMHRFQPKSPKQEIWLFAGARYIKLDEGFSFTTEAQTNDPILAIRSSLTTVDTDNDMVGFQLGGILNHFVTKVVRASFDGRACVMTNFSETHSVVTTNLFPLGEDRMRDETVAFATDAGVSLAWDVNCWCSVTGGYRVMYIDGAALAIRNFNPVLPGNGLRTPFLDTEGSILMQGAHAGLEVRW